MSIEVHAGEMRHRVTIQAPTEVKTSAGGWGPGDPEILAYRVQAAVLPLSGRELQQAAQIDPRMKWKVSMRYVPGVKAQQTIIYHSFEGDRTLEVVAPPEVDDRARLMAILCSEATT